jgi:hypothetical protein
VQTLFDLVSRASLRLGADAVQSFVESTKESTTFSLVWRPALDSLITTGNWSFASVDYDLNRLPDAPVDPRWSYQFQLPGDFLAMRFAMAGDGARLVDDSWVVQAGRLYSSEPQVIAKYLRSFEQDEVGALPSWFSDLFVIRLALDAHEAISGVSNVRDQLQREYGQALQAAKIRDGRDEPTRPFVAPSRLRLSRGGFNA